MTVPADLAGNIATLMKHLADGIENGADLGYEYDEHGVTEPGPIEELAEQFERLVKAGAGTLGRHGLTKVKLAGNGSGTVAVRYSRLATEGQIESKKKAEREVLARTGTVKELETYRTTCPKCGASAGEHCDNWPMRAHKERFEARLAEILEVPT